MIHVINQEKLSYEKYTANGTVWSVLFKYDLNSIRDLFYKKDIPDDSWVGFVGISVDYYSDLLEFDDLATIWATTPNGDISYEYLLSNQDKQMLKEELIIAGIIQ